MAIQCKINIQLWIPDNAINRPAAKGDGPQGLNLAEI